LPLVGERLNIKLQQGLARPKPAWADLFGDLTPDLLFDSRKSGGRLRPLQFDVDRHHAQ
jgi:hypothetical protein